MTAAAALYLDTARLGRMKRCAQWAVRDFARLAGEAALTLYGKNFLFDGFEILPERLKRRCPGLQTWRGIESLKRDLLECIGAPPERECVLAGRSMTLLRLSAQRLAARSTRVLISDLTWPPYAAVASRIIKQQGGKSIGLRLRAAAFSHRLCHAEIVERIVNAFLKSRCDGALLTAVTHDGIRLQLDHLIGRLRAISPTSIILVDASQGIGHVRTELGIQAADFVVAGVHKWLGAGLPLGVGFGTHATINEMGQASHDDPLLSLTTRNRTGARAVAETVNIWPLFSCQAAASELSPAAERLPRSFAQQLRNVEALKGVLAGSPWLPVTPHASMQSGILLARHQHGRRSSGAAHSWREHFQSYGIHLTSYPTALLRLSMPGRRFAKHELARMAAAFLSDRRLA